MAAGRSTYSVPVGGMMSSTLSVDVATREMVESELTQVARTIEHPPDLDELRRRIPQANGDQDTW
jgi:hypothetical protein